MPPKSHAPHAFATKFARRLLWKQVRRLIYHLGIDTVLAMSTLTRPYQPVLWGALAVSLGVNVAQGLATRDTNPVARLCPTCPSCPTVASGALDPAHPAARPRPPQPAPPTLWQPLTHLQMPRPVTFAMAQHHSVPPSDGDLQRSILCTLAQQQAQQHWLTQGPQLAASLRKSLGDPKAAAARRQQEAFGV